MFKYKHISIINKDNKKKIELTSGYEKLGSMTKHKSTITARYHTTLQSRTLTRYTYLSLTKLLLLKF